MLRILTAGESHGPACLAIIEGMPAGVGLGVADINEDLKRRRSDFGRGGRKHIEEDRVEILSGVRYGKTLGSPITLMVRNVDFANWREAMSLEETKNPSPPVTKPRPGHADLAGALKYGQDDIRNISERASARETISRVMAGAAVKQMLAEFAISVASHTVGIGAVTLSRSDYDFDEVAKVFNTDPDIRCVDSATSKKMKQAIKEAGDRKDTLGGVIEVIARGVPAGLGSVMHYDRRLDGRIAQALTCIPSAKAVAIGNAIAGTGMPGSRFHDPISYKDNRFTRPTNNSGGIEGGMTNGENIVCRVFHKPIATLGEPLETVDIATRQSAKAGVERSDICAVPRAGVIAEAMLALVLAEAMIEKFGGDHIDEMKRNFSAYLKERGL
ncbi:MAG TPA: chorismate synthase [Dehalococcoidales bacterium]|nr:chorismate synthase [Dehalococcoidales bacterium]